MHIDTDVKAGPEAGVDPVPGNGGGTRHQN